MARRLGGGGGVCLELVCLHVTYNRAFLTMGSVQHSVIKKEKTDTMRVVGRDLWA